MTRVSELINKLEELKEKHGDCEVNIYKSFGKETDSIDVDSIHFDMIEKDIYIGIYS